MVVHAPFRFSPIPRWVYFPQWGDLVSHDVPFSDGISGEIAIEIEAKTPLLVGGTRRKPLNDVGEVWPFVTKRRLPGGDGDVHAIPSSSLQGMVRSAIEIASFGRLGPFVLDRRFGFRDISPTPTAKQFYQSRMVNHAQPGWLVCVDKAPYIIPCHFARVDFDQLKRLKGGHDPDPTVLTRATNAQDRYRWFLDGRPVTTLNTKVSIGASPSSGHARAVAPMAGAPATDATIVLTGKSQAGTQRGKKKLEFVFHSPDRPNALPATVRHPVDADVWRDFELIHQEQPGRAENPNWGFWKKEYKAGQPVPVFFLWEAGRISTFGTAFMFKTALPLSAHEMLRNSAAEHVSDATDRRLDLPSLIFGAVADEERGNGLKRRASFDDAIVSETPGADVVLERAILLEPKPAYYPAYVRQPGNQQTGTLDAAPRPYAVYAQGSNERERKQPELMGVKVWPARNRQMTVGSPLHLTEMTNVQTTLHALPRGTKFKTTLRVHNLRPTELGAIVWALSLGDPNAWTEGAEIKLRHRLGMAKPLGFGEISIRLIASESRLHSNVQRPAGDPTCAELSKTFVEQVRRDAQSNGIAWSRSDQIRTLLSAADPEFGAEQDTIILDHPSGRGVKALDYMELKPGQPPQGWNDFQRAKSERRFLPTYMKPIPVAQLRIGARVRMNSTGGEGEIVGEPTDPKNPQWLVLLDGQRKPTRYKASLFTVLE